MDPPKWISTWILDYNLFPPTLNYTPRPLQGVVFYADNCVVLIHRGKSVILINDKTHLYQLCLTVLVFIVLLSKVCPYSTLRNIGVERNLNLLKKRGINNLSKMKLVLIIAVEGNRDAGTRKGPGRADFVEGLRQNFNYVKIHTLVLRGSVTFFLRQILTDHILSIASAITLDINTSQISSIDSATAVLLSRTKGTLKKARGGSSRYCPPPPQFRRPWKGIKKFWSIHTLSCILQQFFEKKQFNWL